MAKTKIEFRCTEEERKKVYDMAERHGQSVRDCMLNATIYKRGRSGLDTRQKAAVQRMKTSLNKIEGGIDVSRETEKILKEVQELCQCSKL